MTEHSGSVTLIGEGALRFCRDRGATFEDASCFDAERYRQALQSKCERR